MRAELLKFPETATSGVLLLLHHSSYKNKLFPFCAFAIATSGALCLKLKHLHLTALAISLHKLTCNDITDAVTDSHFKSNVGLYLVHIVHSEFCFLTLPQQWGSTYRTVNVLRCIWRERKEGLWVPGPREGKHLH